MIPLNRIVPLPRNGISLRLPCALLLLVLLAAAPAGAATTSVHVVKLAPDGSSVIDETTVDHHWMEANLPVQGDGVTHYYHQGPTFDEGDPWNPAEDVNVETRDFGAVKGTAVRDLCDLVGGMAPGDAVRIRAEDGFSKTFDYGAIYEPPPRQGDLVLTWYRAGEGSGDAYYEGMRTVFFADTSTNPWGYHVFGNWDMHESLPEARWHYFSGEWPSSSGLSVKYASEIAILSGEGSDTSDGNAEGSDAWTVETGSLTVTSVPAGAAVLIDGETTGLTTNTTVPGMPAGDYRVTVFHPLYEEPAPIWAEIRRGTTEKVHFDLEPATADLQVASVPTGARIVLDGDETGRTTNATLADLAAGDHTVRIGKDGYLDAERTVRLTPGEENVLTVILTPRYGTGTELLRLTARGTVDGAVDLLYWSRDSPPLAAGQAQEFRIPSHDSTGPYTPVRLLVYADGGRDIDAALPKEPQITVTWDGTPLAHVAVGQGVRTVNGRETIVSTFGFDPGVSAPGTDETTLQVANTGGTDDLFGVPGVGLVVLRERAEASSTAYWLYEGAGNASPLVIDGIDPAASRAILVVVADGPGAPPALLLNGHVLSAPAADSGGLAVTSVDAGGLLNGSRAVLTFDPADGGAFTVRTVLLAVGDGETRPGAGEREERGIPAILTERILMPLIALIDAIFGSSPVPPAEEPATPAATAAPCGTPPAAVPAETAELTVRSVPAGARISLDGVYTGRITPWTITGLPAGAATVGLAAEDYLAAEIAVDPATEPDVLLRLVPDPSGNTRKAAFDLRTNDSGGSPKGGLFIDSLPQDAAITLDGKATGALTPRLFGGLKEGSHRVTIRRRTGEATEATAEAWVYPGITTQVMLDLTVTAPAVSVNLSSEAFAGIPFGIDGNAPARTFPQTVAVKPYGSVIYVAHEGVYYARWLGGVTDGDTIAVEPPASPLTTLAVTSTPAGAMIFCDGICTGLATPAAIDTLTEGPHILMVARPGYLPERRVVRMVAQDGAVDAALDFELAPYAYGSLTVTSDPEGAAIYLHQRNTGETTPHTFTYLPIGTYRVGIAWNTTMTKEAEATVSPYRETACTATWSG